MLTKKLLIKCACGCQKQLNKYDSHGRERSFIHGHQRRNIKMSDEHKLKISKANKGKPTWSKGFGKGYYIGNINPNDIKANRRLFLQLKNKNKWQCEECGSIYLNNTRRIQIHHIDNNKGNNSKENLKILCVNCHRKLHSAELYIKYKEAQNSNLFI